MTDLRRYLRFDLVLLLLVAFITSYLFLKYTDYEVESHTQNRVYQAIVNSSSDRFQIVRYPHILTELFVNKVGKVLHRFEISSPYISATYILNSLSFSLLILSFYLFSLSLKNSRIKSLLYLLIPISFSPVFFFTYPNAEDNFGYIGFLSFATILFYRSFIQRKFLTSPAYWLGSLLLFFCIGLNATNLVLIPVFLSPIVLNRSIPFRDKVLAAAPYLLISCFALILLQLANLKSSNFFSFFPRIFGAHSLVGTQPDHTSFFSELARGLKMVFYLPLSYYSPFIKGSTAALTLLTLVLFLKEKFFKSDLGKYLGTILIPIIPFSLLYEPWSIERWDYLSYVLSAITIYLLSGPKPYFIFKLLLAALLIHNFSSVAYSLYFTKDGIFNGSLACRLHHLEREMKVEIQTANELAIDYRYNHFLPSILDRYNKSQVLLVRGSDSHAQAMQSLPNSDGVLINRWPPKNFGHIHSCLVSPSENCFEMYPETKVNVEEISSVVFLPFPSQLPGSCISHH